MLRDRGWKGLQLSVLDYAESAFGDRAHVLPRSWVTSKVIGERAYIDIEHKLVQKKSFASAILGVTEGEGAVMGLEGLLVGPESRWFTDGERDVCILPVAMAEILGIGPEDVGMADIGLMGRSYRVIGLIDGEAIDQMRDLDNESLMPVDTVAEAKKMEEMAGLDPRLMDTAAIEDLYSPAGQQRGVLALPAGRRFGRDAALDCHRRLCRSGDLARRGGGICVAGGRAALCRGWRPRAGVHIHVDRHPWQGLAISSCPC